MRKVLVRATAAAFLLALHTLSAVAQVQDLHFDSDGVQIRYTVQGAGEPVVLVHGFTASVETNWGGPGIIDALVSDGYQVIAMDTRGHGKSGKPHDPAAYGLNMVEDVIRLMDHVGILKAHLAGYSMGGIIALQAVTAYPDRFYSVVLGGAGWTPPGTDVLGGVLDDLATSLEQGKGIGPLVVALTPAGQDPPSAEQIARRNQMFMATNDPLALAAAARGFASFRQVTEAELRANRVPLLAVVGEVDAMKASVDAMRGVASHLEVRVIPGMDHLSAVAHPDLATAIRDFFGQH
jgi:pimeloyl-ACP methyl ester carboxylesterase